MVAKVFSTVVKVIYTGNNDGGSMGINLVAKYKGLSGEKLELTNP